MKSILLPTDFSKNSLNAMDFALKMFKNQDCSFYILNVQKTSAFISDDLMSATSSATIYKTIVGAAKSSMDNVITDFKTKYNNTRHEFHPLLDYDNLIDAINQVIEKFSIDLILMGTKGASSLEKVLFGSNTMHVIQRCHAPVLAIPNKCKFSNMSNILFLTTTIKPHKLYYFNLLKRIVDEHKSKLFLLQIADRNHLAYALNDKDDMKDSFFKGTKYDYIDTNDKDVISEIKSYYRENNIKMLAIMNKKLSLLKRLFSKDVLENLAYKIDIPLLVFPSSK